jgi:hypothetical protein
MWNVSIVALISIVAIATPVVFFITDLANPSIAGWGDYFRWVGAAAASVIVWEWVERIEALEREEKKDGILGTEVFDGDESDDSLFHGDGSRRRRRRQFWAGRGIDNSSEDIYTSGFDSFSRRIGQSTSPRPIQRLPTELSPARRGNLGHTTARNAQVINSASLAAPTPPPQTISPISRTDTTSPSSTVYAVQYNTVNLTTPPVIRPNLTNQGSRTNPADQVIPEQDITEISDPSMSEKEEATVDSTEQAAAETATSKSRLPRFMRNPFNSKTLLPPTEVRHGHVIDPVTLSSPIKQQPIHKYATWDIKGRLGAFAAEQGEKIRDLANPQHQKEEDLPVTIIPAQRRPGLSRRPWSPDATSAIPQAIVTQDNSQLSPGSAAGTRKSVVSQGGGESTTGAVAEGSVPNTASPPSSQPKSSQEETKDEQTSPS